MVVLFIIISSTAVTYAKKVDTSVPSLCYLKWLAVLLPSKYYPYPYHTYR
jgi:hypothetical protein